MKALVGAFNQEKALVGAFSVIVQPIVEPMEHYTALHQADCDDAEDERLEECYTAYLSQGHINKYATLRCQDKVHPKMQGRPYHTFLIMS